MSLEWTLPDDAGRWPVRGPLYTVRLVVLALAVGGALLWLQHRRLTLLQQAALPNYIRSGGAAALGLKSGGYRQLVTVEGRRSHMATVEDLAGAVTLAWDEETRNHAQFHGELRRWIFDDQTLGDLAWWPVVGAALCFLIGLPFAIPKDITRWRERRQGMRIRGPELVTPAAFTKRLKGDGYGFRLGKGTVQR